MNVPKKLTTTLSTKGQMVLPKAVRESRGWGEGMRLVVEDRPEGVLLKAEPSKPLFPPTHIDDVVGILKRPGQRRVSDAEMHAAVREAAAARYERSFRKC